MYDVDGLTILHDGWTSWSAGTSSKHLLIPGWNPQRGWQFGFGASSWQWTDYHWIDNLFIWSTWLVAGPSPFELEVTMNGQQFVSTGTNISYLAYPAISTLIPKTGPAAGNTQIRIDGVNLAHGDNYTCRFGSTVVPAELIDGPGGGGPGSGGAPASPSALPSIRCSTPSIVQSSAQSFVEVRVAVSLNNQDYTVDPIDFSYREPTVVSSINPDAGPVAGGSLVRVSGAHFAGGDGFRCMFGDLPPVRAVLQGSFTLGYYLECYAPALNSTAAGEMKVPLEVTVNNQQYTANLVPFRYFAPQSLDDILPTSGPVLGSTSVLVSFRSDGASSDSTFYCRFGKVLSVGALVATGRVACPSPATTLAGPAMLSISTNAQQFSNTRHFFYYAHPRVSEISPTSGPVQAGTLVDVRGAFLGNGSQYRCVFGITRVTATYVAGVGGASGLVRCQTNAMAAPGDQVFRVSLNAQQYTEDPHLFNFFTPPSISALSPSSGPVLGATAIRLAGTGFDGGSHYLCRFEEQIVRADGANGAALVAAARSAALSVPAVRVSLTEATCVSPAVVHEGARPYSLRLSLNGQQFSPEGQVVFTMHGLSKVHSSSPSSGPIAGGTLVVNVGVHLGNGSDYRCRFGSLVVNATHQSDASLAVSCYSPLVASFGPVALEVAQNGQQFTSSNNTFTFYGPPSIGAPDTAITSLFPVAGPSDGSTLVEVRGNALTGGSDYRCKFADVGGIPASFVNDGAIACRSPPLPAESVAVVTVALNAQQYLEVGVNFSVYPPNRVVRLSPSTGTSVGGTVVTVTGTHFRSYAEHPVLCRFANQTATTTLIDSSTLECIAPLATAAGVAVAADPSFSVAGALGGTLLGNARLAHGVLELTQPHHFQTGTFHLALPPRSVPFRWFRLRFEMSVGGGHRWLLTPKGGMGMSLVFGLLPDGAFGELGAGHHLRLCFLTANATLTAHYANRYLARADLAAAFGSALGGFPREPAPAVYAQVELSYARGTLSVRVNDQLLLSLRELPLESAQTTRWAFGFGARTGLYHDAHRLANMTFRSGSYEFADDVAVEVTQNLETYTVDNARFVYQPIPRVSSISVSRGPLSGSTRVLLYGSNFSRAAHTLCKFGSTIVNGTVRETADGLVMPMACDSPPHVEGSVPLELTLNGQDYTTDGLNYSFYALQLSHASPSGGPLAGGALLTIWGDGLGSGAGYHRYLCRFAQGMHKAVVAATYLAREGVVRCTSPTLVEAGMAGVSVSANGQQFTPNGQLGFLVFNTSVTSVDPPYSIHRGGQPINVSVPGALALSSPHYACRFAGHPASLATGFNASVGVDRWYGTALVPATLSGGSVGATLSCITPSAGDAGIARRLFLGFDSPLLPPGLALAGSAIIADGMLQLTQAMHHEHGSLVLRPARETGTSPWPWRSFDLRLLVHIGGGGLYCTYDSARGGKVCGGEGMSLSYGPLPDKGLGLQGGGTGLRVAFETGARFGPSILITYDNIHILRHSLLPAGWRRDQWVALRVGYGTHDSPEGLVIERNGATDLRGIVLQGWAPESSWQLAISASTGLAVDHHWIDNFTLVTDALIARMDVTVEVTLNGQQFTSSQRSLSYDAPIAISAFSPTSGPTSGQTRVTVFGFMFAHGLSYSCRFGNETVLAIYNASTLDVVCPTSPAQISGDHEFAISLDGLHWVTAQAPFTFYEGQATSIVPTGGPLHGATSVLVQGTGLGRGSDYRCRYRGPNPIAITTVAGPFPPNPTVGSALHP